MVTLVEKYRPTQPPADPEKLGDFLRDELERIAEHMAGRDEVVTGGVTLSSGTASVVFAREQPDTAYQILVAGNVTAGVATWSAKAVTGFTVTGAGGGAGNVQWAIFRDRDND